MHAYIAYIDAGIQADRAMCHRNLGLRCCFAMFGLVLVGPLLYGWPIHPASITFGLRSPVAAGFSESHQQSSTSRGSQPSLIRRCWISGTPQLSGFGFGRMSGVEFMCQGTGAGCVVGLGFTGMGN